jgi:hypothetical protein
VGEMQGQILLAWPASLGMRSRASASSLDLLSGHAGIARGMHPPASLLQLVPRRASPLATQRPKRAGVPSAHLPTP